MGYYIEVPGHTGKAQQVRDIFGAGVWHPTQPVPAGKVPICVVQNGFFDAVAVAYDQSEVDAFNDPYDHRQRDWLLMDRDQVLGQFAEGERESLEVKIAWPT